LQREFQQSSELKIQQESAERKKDIEGLKTESSTLQAKMKQEKDQRRADVNALKMMLKEEEQRTSEIDVLKKLQPEVHRLNLKIQQEAEERKASIAEHSVLSFLWFKFRSLRQTLLIHEPEINNEEPAVAPRAATVDPLVDYDVVVDIQKLSVVNYPIYFH